MTSPGSFKIGGDGGDAFPFDKVGDTVTGTIMSVSEVQQTDMDTNQPAYWEDGKPKIMWKVALQTELRAHQGDPGVRSVFLRGAKKPGSGSSLAAVLDAVVAAGGTNELQTGGVLTMTYTGDGKQERRGYNPPKKYAATYVQPSVAIGGDTAAVSAAPQAPATQPAAAAPAAAAPAVGSAAAVTTPPASGKPTVSAAQFAALVAANMDVSGFDIAPA